MAQTVKTFRQDRDNPLPLDDQINNFTKENPKYAAKEISVIVGPAYREAFVIFNIDDRTNDDRKNKDYKKDQRQQSQNYNNSDKSGGSK